MARRRAPAALLVVVLAVFAAGVAAAAVRGGSKARPAAVVRATAPRQVTSPAGQPPAGEVQAGGVQASQAKPAAAAKAPPAAPRPATAAASKKLPFTGPAPIPPTVGLAALLIAAGAWALGAPRPRWLSAGGGTALDRLRARGRYHPYG